MAIHAAMEREKALDYRAGLQVATMLNIAPRKRGHSRVYEPQDFFPSLKPAPRNQTPTQQRNAIMAIATFSGATIKRIPAAELEAIALGN